GDERAERTGRAERGQHHAEDDGDGERRLQRPVELVLLAALRGYPVRAEPLGFWRGGPARRRPRIRVRGRVLPSQLELAGGRGMGRVWELARALELARAGRRHAPSQARRGAAAAPPRLTLGTRARTR